MRTETHWVEAFGLEFQTIAEIEPEQKATLIDPGYPPEVNIIQITLGGEGADLTGLLAPSIIEQWEKEIENEYVR